MTVFIIPNSDSMRQVWIEADYQIRYRVALHSIGFQNKKNMFAFETKNKNTEELCIL